MHSNFKLSINFNTAYPKQGGWAGPRTSWFRAEGGLHPELLASQSQTDEQPFTPTSTLSLRGNKSHASVLLTIA